MNVIIWGKGGLSLGKFCPRKIFTSTFRHGILIWAVISVTGKRNQNLNCFSPLYNDVLSGHRLLSGFMVLLAPPQHLRVRDGTDTHSPRQSQGPRGGSLPAAAASPAGSCWEWLSRAGCRLPGPAPGSKWQALALQKGVRCSGGPALGLRGPPGQREDKYVQFITTE